MGLKISSVLDRSGIDISTKPPISELKTYAFPSSLPKVAKKCGL